MTEQQFCQYFQMSRECFDLLCTTIKRNVGEGTFKSDEAYSEVVGRRWSDNVQDKVSRCGLNRPHTNWYRSNNRLYDDELR